MNLKKSYEPWWPHRPHRQPLMPPWDIDLVDAVYYRGYEWEMATPQEGSVTQNLYSSIQL